MTLFQIGGNDFYFMWWVKKTIKLEFGNLETGVKMGRADLVTILLK